jgi:ketosteroid isomerase-like protein
VSQRHKLAVERVLQALVDDEGHTTHDVVADDVTWWVPASAAAKFGLARPLRGWDDVPWFGGPGWKGFEPGSSTLEIHHLVAEDDLVSAHYRRTARRVDGGRYDAEYNILFRFDGDRIAEVWEVADTAAAFAPPPGRQ